MRRSIPVSPRRRLAALGLTALLAVLAAGCARVRSYLPFLAGPGGPYDLVIAGGTVVDGTGSPGYRADVAVVGDRIVRITERSLARAQADRVVDATGLVVAPGFIDARTRLDGLLRLPDAESQVRQGVTTALGGADGFSPTPLFIHLDSLERAGVGMNVAFLAGHNTIRQRVMGLEDRHPRPDELEAMRRLVAEAMRDGAWGVSTGLEHAPGAFAGTTEIVALAEVASDSGGIYTSRLRGAGPGPLEGVAEALEIGRRAVIPVVFGRGAVGEPGPAAVEATAMVDSARSAGERAWLDAHPYTASYTDIAALVPAWAREGGDEAFLRRTRDIAYRDSIVEGIIDNVESDRAPDDLRRIRLAEVPWMPELEGKTLYDWARMKALDPVPEAGAELVIEAIRRGGARAIVEAMSGEDVARILGYPHTVVASDGRLTRPGAGHSHPGWYGTFPRVLGSVVREDGVLTLPEAVRRMTSLPARVIGFRDRGVLKAGMYADIVVFDPATVEDRASFEDPHRYPAGIPWVIVNGTPVVADGTFVGGRPGWVLRRPPGWSLADRRAWEARRRSEGDADPQ